MGVLKDIVRAATCCVLWFVFAKYVTGLPDPVLSTIIFGAGCLVALLTRRMQEGESNE
jgi:hypothetical protein